MDTDEYVNSVVVYIIKQPSTVLSAIHSLSFYTADSQLGATHLISYQLIQYMTEVGRITDKYYPPVYAWYVYVIYCQSCQVQMIQNLDVVGAFSS
jgi:hypothetical protein